MDAQEQTEILENLLKFLQRVPLKGSEVPAYSAVWNWVNSIGLGERVVIPAPSLIGEQDGQ